MCWKRFNNFLQQLSSFRGEIHDIMSNTYWSLSETVAWIIRQAMEEQDMQMHSPDTCTHAHRHSKVNVRQNLTCREGWKEGNSQWRDVQSQWVLLDCGRNLCSRYWLVWLTSSSVHSLGKQIWVMFRPIYGTRDSGKWTVGKHQQVTLLLL